MNNGNSTIFVYHDLSHRIDTGLYYILYPSLFLSLMNSHLPIWCSINTNISFPSSKEHCPIQYTRINTEDHLRISEYERIASVLTGRKDQLYHSIISPLFIYIYPIIYHRPCVPVVVEAEQKCLE
jgi:hypothetical protein